MYSACKQDLTDYAVESRLGRASSPHRPRPDQCDIYVFPQTWGSTALGFGGIGGQAMTSAYTVVVVGPGRDACVYFGSRLAYHIEHPNREFMEDLAAHSMKDRSRGASRYETKKVE